jgi:TatA/E family protein of Tat protein translocase
MFGSIGPQELLIVLVIALVVLGPSKLPEMARSLGKGVKEFKEGINEGMDDSDQPVEAGDPISTDEVKQRSRADELPPAEPRVAELPPAEPARAGARDAARP